MKTHPYIGQCYSVIALFYAEGKALLVDDALGLDEASVVGDKLNLSDGTNITHEYLANTYGEVVSPEHAEFIVELAELHGIKRAFTSPMKTINAFAFKGGNLYLYGLGLDELTQLPTRKITIPLPPKADKQELSEWPCVGSVVTWGNKSVKGEVKALSDGLAWIKNEYGNYCSEYVSSLQKPKTPEEELRDDILDCDNFAITESKATQLANWLTNKGYEIKKKPQ